MHKLFSQVHHFIESRRDLLFGLSENLNEVLSLLGIALSKKCIRCACVFGPGCTTNTVDIVFSVAWEVKVDDKLYIADI